MRDGAPITRRPREPAHRVDRSDADVHHHVVAVVEVDERHVVDVVGKECRATSRRGGRFGVVRAHEPEEEGEERVGDDGEGTKVVHLLGELEGG